MAFSAEQLNIIVSARTQDLDRQLRNAERNIRRLESQSRRSLGQTSRNFNMLGAAAKRLAPILAGALSVQAIRGAAQQAKEIQNLSNIAGVTAVEFQKLAIASNTVGVSQEKVADIIKDVNDKFGDFMATGAGPMADFFENVAPLVGVTAEQFAKLSGPEALQLYVDSLQRAGASQQQMTFYMEALASDATALIPLLANNGAEMRRLGDEAERSGRILGDDAVAAGARLDRKMNELSTTLTTKLQEAILDNADEITDFADKAIPIMVGGLTNIGETASAVAGHISGLVSEISSLASEAQGFYDSIADWAKTSGLTIDRFFPDGDIPDWLRTMRGEVPANDPRSAGRGNGINLVRSRSNNRTSPDQALYGTTTGTPLGLGGLLLPPSGRTIPSVSPDTKPSKGGGGSDRDPLADLMKRIVLEQELLGASEARRQVLEAIAGSDKKYTDDAIDGAVSRIEAYEAEKQAMERIQSEQQAIADTLQNSMESAFMSIVDGTKTAEDAFRDMAKQIIMELYRVLVVQRLVGSFNSATGQGTGIVGAIAGALTGRASGGSVQAGRAYMTGESGRELFVPSTNGRILSPAQTSSAMRSGGGIVVQQTINVSTGVQQTVRSEIQTMLPQISEAAKSAVADAKRRGGSYGRALR